MSKGGLGRGSWDQEGQGKFEQMVKESRDWFFIAFSDTKLKRHWRHIEEKSGGHRFKTECIDSSSNGLSRCFHAGKLYLLKV